MRHDETSLAPTTNALASVAGLVVVLAALTAGVGFAFDLARAGEWSFVGWLVGPALAASLFAVFAGVSAGVATRWAGVRLGDFTRGTAACVALVVAAWLFCRAVASPGSPRESWLARLYLQLGDPSTLREHVPSIVVVLIVFAIAEEIVWRGYVPLVLERWTGASRAWIAAAGLYAAVYLPTVWLLRDPEAGKNPIVVLGALAMGLVLGAMRRVLGRLLPGIIAHVMFDWTVLMMFRLWGPSV